MLKLAFSVEPGYRALAGVNIIDFWRRQLAAITANFGLGRQSDAGDSL